MTGFSKEPRPVTLITTLSPLFKNFGGVNPIPTPTGVPVAITSPASNVPVNVNVSIRDSQTTFHFF